MQYPHFAIVHILVPCQNECKVEILATEKAEVFDRNKTFGENLSVYRAACDALDPECAAILFSHLDDLRSAGADATSRTKFIAAFNGKVKTDVFALPDSASQS